jgi:hypothetical protein
MFLETFVLFSTILIVLFVFAELTRQPVLALFPSILLFIFGIWLITDNIQIHSGEYMTYNENRLEDIFYNGTMLGTGEGLSNINSTIIGNTTTSNENFTQLMDTLYNETGVGTINVSGTQNSTYNYQSIGVPVYWPITFGNLIGTLFILLGFYTTWRYGSWTAFGKPT